MNDNQIFTDPELSSVDQIKALLYGSGLDINGVKTALSQLAARQRSAVLEAAVFETSAEQAQRRRYILGTILNPAANFDQKAAEVLILAAAANTGQIHAQLPKLGLRPTDLLIDPQTNPELLEQCRIFAQAEANLAELYTELLKRQRVLPYFGAIKNLAPADRDALISQIDQYLNNAAAAIKEDPTVNPPLPSPLLSLLDKTGLGLTAGSFDSLEEKVSFLLSVLYVAEGQKEAGTSDEAVLQTSIARLMYLQNFRPKFELS